MSHDDLANLLKRVDRETTVPPIDPAREADLMAAFDAARESPHLVVWRSRWLAAAAALAIVGGAAALWMAFGGDGFVAQTFRSASGPPRQETVATAPAPSLEDESEFVLWPGASALPPIENGRLLRMDVPATMLLASGVFRPAPDAATVRAEVLIGQDGFARAFRVVSISSDEGQQP